MRTRISKILPYTVRHTYRFDAQSSMLDGFYIGTVFQLLSFVGRKTVMLTDWQHNLLMAAIHLGLLITPLVQALVPMRRKEFVVSTWVIARCSCLLLLVPYFHSGWPFAVLTTWIISFTVMRIPAHASILRSNYPAGVRNRVLSRVRFLQLLVTVPTSLLVGVLIERWERLYWPLAVLAAAVSLAGAWRYTRIRARGESHGEERLPLAPLRTVLHIMRHDRQFFWYQFFYVMGGIPNLWSIPLYVRFIADVDGGLGAQYIEIAIMTGLIQPVVMAVSLGPWGRLHDRMRSPILQRALVGFVFAVHPLCFAMADSVSWAYLAYVVFGFVTAGASLNWTLGSLAFGRPDQATAYSSIHTMLTGARGVAAPWLGTLLAVTIGLKPTFVLASVMMLASSAGMVGLHLVTRGSWFPSKR